MLVLTEAVIAGARDPEIEGVAVVVRSALEASVEDVLQAHGYLLGTAAHFGYMSGALKQIGGSLSEDGEGGPSSRLTAGRPFGLYVHGRYDTTGAVRSVRAITGALPWWQAAEVREVLGDVTDEGARSAYALGATLAAHVATSSHAADR